MHCYILVRYNCDTYIYGLYLDFIVSVGVERSFSTLNRLCSKLRQRLTPDHLSQLLLIAQEGPEQISRHELIDIVYLWYDQAPRRIQLPHRDC